MIPRPLAMHRIFHFNTSVLWANGGGLGILFLSGFKVQLWNMKTDCDGVVSWVLKQTFELDRLLSVNLNKRLIAILRIVVYNKVLLLNTHYVGLFMIQLESPRFKKVSEIYDLSPYHAFESVYTAGNGMRNTTYNLMIYLKDCFSHSLVVS